MKRLVLRVSGVVQGIGFRPFVHRLAVAHGLAGHVRNGPCGVEIEIEGTEVDAFVREVARGPTGETPEIAIEERASATPAAGDPATSVRADARPTDVGGHGSIRVAVDKIDLLMNMVGELVITQSMLGELDADGLVDARRLQRLRQGLSLLARNTRSIQESVMRLRSMPISTATRQASSGPAPYCRSCQAIIALSAPIAP